ncbi:AMP-binding protein [Shimia sp. R9_2]|uniref:AMP-binding protein n=1 Tax=Shimia sp. R9_2 TaxID=2821112 RepID=UPI001ADCA675|nr:AMP-binding protein [Shimia sp. R9_2]MBO9397967.1 AMP-binding protein [Shimia sp. R9_2]
MHNLAQNFENGFSLSLTKDGAPLAEETPNIPGDWFTRFGFGPQVAPRFASVLAGFAHYAALQPEAVALECEGETMTYGALDEASDRLAQKLRDLGIGHQDAVGLYLKRSIPMVVGILAIMKLGAIYVPQHLGVATESALRHISTVTNAKVVLTLEARQGEVPLEEGQHLLAIEEVMRDASLPRLSEMADLQGDDICMVLFTSGTTGVPNGVQVTHQNLANILLTAPGDLGMRPGLRVGQILSIAFDMAAWEILGCLSNGATLVIRGCDIQATAETVDILIATPSILGSLDATACQQVKAAAVAGEPCPRPLADKWGSFCDFYNSCGPTETTIINTAMRHHPEKADLTIGKPTPNNTVYILDEALNPLPFGATGEMWAGGDCVTAGYLANPELNAQRYRLDPFRPGHLMFRTRDLGAWTETGELLHFGRVDDLVKIRGFRVELDGVSRALEETPCCEQAVTLKFDDRTLVSFVSPADVCPKEARARVENKLPYYCVPKVVLPMADLPKTPRGKLDKRLLLQRAEEAIRLSGQEAAE